MMLKHSLRSLLRQPAFAVTAILTLALGIGANTAIFSAVYHTLIAPLPFRDSDRLAYVWLSSADSRMSISPPPEYAQAWRESARQLEAVEPFSFRQIALSSSSDTREMINAGWTTHTMAGTLGLRPVLGRMFSEEEVRTGARVLVITEGFWKLRYGGERSVLGERLMVDGEPHTIIGVMPAHLSSLNAFETNAEVFLPWRPDPKDLSVNVLVKLREGVTTGQALNELKALSAGVSIAHPLPDMNPKLMQPQDFLDHSTRTTLTILFAAVGVVLLIACANVAGLMLVQVTARRRELAIRAALGASRARILLLVAADSFLLALGGGFAGVLLSSWAIDLVRRFRPAELISLSGLTIDGPALFFAAAASILTALLFGLLPALTVARLDLARPIAAGGGSARTTARGGLRAALVVGEVALSLVLLVGASLLVRSLLYMQKRDLGYETSNIMIARLELPEDAFPNAAARQAVLDGVRTQLRAVPGVTRVALGETPPGLGIMFGQLELEDQPGRKDLPTTLGGAHVEAGLLDVLGIQLLRGRTFDMRPEDRDKAVINVAMAEKYWPGQNALGRRFRMSAQGNWMTVVGISENIAASGPQHSNSSPIAFFPFGFDYGFATIALPYQGDAATVAAAVRNILTRADERIRITEVTTMRQKVAETLARDRFSMTLLLAFALCALLLCIVGLYGVVSHAVTQSTREIGVRVALGASPHNIRRWVLRQASRITVLGVLLGCAGGYAAARLGSSMLHGVRPQDPISFVVSVLLLTACALSASWFPVRRAARVDPIAALRSE